MEKKTGKRNKRKNGILLPVLALFCVSLGIAAYLSYTFFTAGQAAAAAVPAATAIYAVLAFFCLFMFIREVRKQRAREAKKDALNKLLSGRVKNYSSAFQKSTIGLAVFNSRFEILDYNAAFEKIAGKPDGDIVSSIFKDFAGPEPVNDLDGFATVRRFVRPGLDLWAKIRFSALENSRDGSANYLCIVEDLTESISAVQALRESERSKSVILNNLPGMAYRCKYDRNWTMQFVSDGCLTLTGYQPESLLDNREISYNDVILPEYREAVWNEWERVLDSKAAFQYEYEIQTAAGDRKWVYEQGQGIYDENGDLCALEGLIFDITPRKKREIENRYLTEHDLMTGLKNRGFFQLAKLRLNAGNSLPLAVIIANINGVRLINDAFGHTEGDRLIVMTAKIIKSLCRPNDVLARTGGDEFGILLPNTDLKTAVDLVKSIKEAFGEYNNGITKDANFISLSMGCAVKTAQEEDIDQVYKAAEEYMYKQKLLDRKSSHSAILSSIKATLFARSQETEEHAERLAKLSVSIGSRLSLTQAKLDELELLAILHDIGKIGIDDRILNKPEKLDAEEWEIMKKHPEIGFRIAMSSPVFQPIAECILFHHERWDGKGYPHGLKGNQIPLLSRILAVSDAYDAMTEDRPYRSAMPSRDAIEEIRQNAGKQFDPEVVRIFLENELAGAEPVF